MPRNEVAKESEETRAEEATVKPVSVKTTLSGPRSVMIGGGVAPCSLKIPSNILQESGLKPNDQIELSTAGNGVIIITKTGDPLPGLPFKTPENVILKELMRLTHDYEKRQREARNGPIMADMGGEEPKLDSEEPFEDMAGEPDERA